MNTATIEINIPVELADYATKQDVSVQRAMLIYPFIRRGDISYGKAAKLLGMNKLDLISLYGKLGIPYFEDEEEVFINDLATLKNLRSSEV